MSKLTTKQHQALQSVGRWATLWLAVTGVYLVWLFWLSKDYYVDSWTSAISQAYSDDFGLKTLLEVVTAGWVLIVYFWFEAMRKAKIKYSDGIKDLFFTLR
jgi:hypothetical protein